MTLMRYGKIEQSATHCAALLAAALLTGLSGCAMCCAPYDYDYGYTGGAWVRDNPSCGRVGSAFDPAGYKALEDDAPTTGQPTPAGRSPAVEELDPDQPMPDAPPMLEGIEPAPRVEPAPGMISAPRLRPVRNYLPEN